MLRRNRKEIHFQKYDIKGVPLLLCQFLYTHNEHTNSLISFAAKNTKNIILLYNIHFQEEISKMNNLKFKPSIILKYNVNKGGVD